MPITAVVFYHIKTQLCDYISSSTPIASLNDIISFVFQEWELGTWKRGGDSSWLLCEKRSYLTVGADGSQLCVWAQAWEG